MGKNHPFPWRSTCFVGSSTWCGPALQKPGSWEFLNFPWANHHGEIWCDLFGILPTRSNWFLRILREDSPPKTQTSHHILDFCYYATIVTCHSNRPFNYHMKSLYSNENLYPSIPHLYNPKSPGEILWPHLCELRCQKTKYPQVSDIP